MKLLDDMAIDLARETLEIIEATGDEELEQRMGDQLGTSSQTLQEAFQTAMRVLKAEKRARATLAQLRRQAGLPDPEA
jgi:hypothetical protein